MKKLILVLSVVAMAAFLLVGCLPKTNTAPVITYSASQTATVGTEFISTITATDAEGDTLIFSVSDGPTGMVIDSATGVINGWTPAAVGTETVLVTVTDGKDPSTLTVTITVVVPAVGDITIAVATETLPDADGKIFVKGGSKEITVTFPTAVENPLVKVGTADVPMFSTTGTDPGKVWKGTHKFVGNDAVTITVSGECEPLCTKTKSVVVDSLGPVVELKAKAAECDCEDSYALTITTEQLACVGCVTDPDCCKDAGSGMATWNVKIFDADPWKIPAVDPCDPCTEECPPCCSDDPCIDPIAELDGTACPIILTTECITKVWAEVDGVNQWVGYFDKYYWVIATLTDNVGNKITYYGIVTPSTDKTKNYVYNFAEIHHPTDKTWCWCYAEDWFAADSVLGDCSGTPTTECYTTPLEKCPVITFSPTDPIAGEEVTITIDYTLADKPENPTAYAYISPSSKSLPLGIPEGADPLDITDADEDDIWVATHIFGQDGVGTVFVCDNLVYNYCSESVTVSARVCPTIVVDDAVPYLGDMWVDADDHEVTITFASPIPIEQVRAFRVGNLEGDWEAAILPEDSEELILSTEDNLVYTATARFTSHDACDEDYVIVQYGESCCPVICTEMFMVDDEDPCVELSTALVDCSECDTATEVWISSDTCAYDTADCPCTNALDCCDECTTFDWTLTVYDDQPFELDDCDVCIANICANVVASDTGTGCPVDLKVLDCTTEAEWAELEITTYYVVFEAEDIVGNDVTEYGILTVDTTDFGNVTLGNATYSTGTCQIGASGSATIMGGTGCSCP